MEEPRRRGRPKISNLDTPPNGPRTVRTPCPICRRPLKAEEFDVHYGWELNRLISLDYVSDPEPETPVVTGKRGAAVAARKQLASSSKRRRSSEDDLAAEEDERALRAIRRNRLARNANEQPRNRRRSANEEQQTCFICNMSLTGLNVHEVNHHIDQCLTRDEETEQQPAVPPPPNVLAGTSDQDTYEEYEWAGQTRVRATSMLAGGMAVLGHTVSRNHRGSEDIEDDLNIDEDDNDAFGSAQYDDSFLQRDQTVEKDSDATVTDEEVGPSTGPLEQDRSTPGPPLLLAMERHEGAPAGGSALVVNSLKERIRQLEAINRNSPRCLICLEAYKIPVTSVVCWHTHCEGCWMRSLGAKKVCPQCQVITSAGDLRRVYL